MNINLKHLLAGLVVATCSFATNGVYAVDTEDTTPQMQDETPAEQSTEMSDDQDDENHPSCGTYNNSEEEHSDSDRDNGEEPSSTDEE